jgi:hypothetical protein
LFSTNVHHLHRTHAHSTYFRPPVDPPVGKVPPVKLPVGATGGYTGGRPPPVISPVGTPRWNHWCGCPDCARYSPVQSHVQINQVECHGSRILEPRIHRWAASFPPVDILHRWNRRCVAHFPPVDPPVEGPNPTGDDSLGFHQRHIPLPTGGTISAGFFLV